MIQPPPRMTAGVYTRREFVALAAGTAVGLSAGCATNPVTGRQQFMLVSEDSEVDMDRKAVPHQFSSDCGPIQDASVNAYVSEVGGRLAANSHRPTMPYSFRTAYERALPGNPNSAFFSGYCLAQTGRRQQAAAEYQRYLRSSPSGSYAAHAQNRMVEWGYFRPTQQPQAR